MLGFLALKDRDDKFGGALLIETSLGHEIFDVTTAQIEAVIEPDCVLDGLRREAVTIVHRCGFVHSTIVV